MVVVTEADFLDPHVLGAEHRTGGRARYLDDRFQIQGPNAKQVIEKLNGGP